MWQNIQIQSSIEPPLIERTDTNAQFNTYIVHRNARITEIMYPVSPISEINPLRNGTVLNILQHMKQEKRLELSCKFNILL